MLGEQGLQEVTYTTIEDKKAITFKVTNALARHHRQVLGGDAAARHRRAACRRASRRARSARPRPTRPTTCSTPQTVAPGATGAANARLFAGAKEVAIVDGYDKALKLNRFELLIDWGWFYFITKPMFLAIDWFFQLVGNFGVAILIVTVLIKIVFFPLANKSYASMAKMKAVQPQMMAIRERYADDKMKQQQALMELYKKEKINPLAGCLPILIQIPVFFALYKVLFVTIEMRHAPFFGWIKDLSAPDPTNLFNLFGLIPFDPTVLPVLGPFLHRRRLAADHGRHDVGADEAQPGAARPDAEDDLRLDAADLHLHAGELLGRPGDLLGLEQHALGAAAGLHHAQARRQDRAVGQPQATRSARKKRSSERTRARRRASTTVAPRKAIEVRSRWRDAPSPPTRSKPAGSCSPATGSSSGRGRLDAVAAADARASRSPSRAAPMSASRA